MWCVKGSDFQEAKDYTDDSGSCLMIVWAINEDDVICERCKRYVEEHKRIGWYTFIVSLLSQVTVDHSKNSLSCKRYVQLQLFC